jgi:hypothetical protein
MRVQWSRSDVNLVLNGHGVAIPPLFHVVPSLLCAVSTARKVICQESNLFHSITGLDDILMRVQWSRANVNLVLNGQGMAIPPFFLHMPLPLYAISTARKMPLKQLVSPLSCPRIPLYHCTVEQSRWSFWCLMDKQW